MASHIHWEMGISYPSKFPSTLREASTIILESNDGIQFLVDGNGARLELETIIHNLFALHQNPSTFFSMRRHVLNALLGMVYALDGQIVMAIAKKENVISILLPLVEGSDKQICKYVNKLLCFLSEGDY